MSDPTPAPSPFLPGTSIQFAWDSTSLSYLKDCPRKYYYFMVLGIRPRGTGLHLLWGQWYQKAMEVYAKARAAGADHDSALLDACLQALRDSVLWDFPGETKKTRENLLLTIVWKLDRMKDTPLQTMILSDGIPAVELSFRFELDWDAADGQPYILCGHFDEIVDYQGQPFVLDNKTTGSTLSPSYFDQYSPHNQMSLYNIAGQVVLGQRTHGVLIDAAQVAVGFSEFSRGFAHRTKGQDEEWLDSLAGWLRFAKDHAELQAEYEAAPNGYPPERAWPMNDMACSKFGGCVFQSLCTKDPSVRKQFIDANYEKARWNPLVVR